MAKKDGKDVAVEAAPAAEAERSPMFEAVRKIMLAYVGGLAIAWDEVEDLIQRFVERGEVAEKDARKLLQEMREKRGTVTGGVDRRLEELLHRMDIPTKGDIDALTANIAALTAKVEELKKKQV